MGKMELAQVCPACKYDYLDSDEQDVHLAAQVGPWWKLKHEATVSFVSYLGVFSPVSVCRAMPVKYIGGDPELVFCRRHSWGPCRIHALLFVGVGRQWNMTALIHGFIAAVVPAGPFLFDGMLISGEYDLEKTEE